MVKKNSRRRIISMDLFEEIYLPNYHATKYLDSIPRNADYGNNFAKMLFKAII